MSENPLTVRSVLFNTALILVPFLMFLVLAEVGLRVYLSSNIFYDVEMARYANELKQESNNPLVGHVHRPNQFLHVMGVDVVINSDGFRDDEYTHARNKKKRYILLGDSLTFGWGVEKSQSFEHLLERKLDETVPSELINFGTGNYNTTQEVNLFLEKGLQYRPDGVFLFYFINDAEPIPVKSRYAWLARLRLATFFWSRINALTAIRTPGQSFQEYYAKLYQEDQAGWRQTRAALVELKNACSKHGISLKVVILPELHNLAAYPFVAEHALLTAYLSKHDIEYIDLASHFTGETNPMSLWVARDDAHPNAKAHRLIAEMSFPFLAGASN